MKSTILPEGTFKLADDLVLTRVGYGAMQLAGPHVFGPPADHDGAIALLRELEVRRMIVRGGCLSSNRQKIF